MNYAPPDVLSLENTSISLDARGGEVVFVSHAHTDHAVNNAPLLLASKQTRDLMVSRGYKYRDFSESMALEDAKLEMLPAGHVLGSRQVRIEKNSHVFTYTGDIKLTSSLTSEPCVLKQSDTLVMEATFGSPHYKFPDQEQVRQQITTWVQGNQKRGAISVLGAYAVGKAQEVIATLNKYADITPVVSSEIHETSEIYKQHGVPLSYFAPNTRDSEEELARAFVAVVPLNKLSNLLASNLSKAYGRPVSIAPCTGWAVDSRNGFALSDHADYGELNQIIEAVQPKNIYLFDGFSREFARELQARGLNAVSLDEPKGKKAAADKIIQQTLA